MAEGGSDEIAEKIVCGLCSEEYKQPKLLPCFHSFCLECLQIYVKTNGRDNNFECPLCDKTIEMPEGGVNVFEWNIYLDSRLKSEATESHGCDICGPETNATNRCLECEENYCERCSDVHTKQKMSRTHTLLAISGPMIGSRIVMMKKMFCKKHPKDEIRVVCKDCDKMLCIVCKLTDHEKHNSVDIEDEALRVKKSLKETIQKAEMSVFKLNKMLEELNDAKTETCRIRDNTLENIQKHGDKLKEQIDGIILKIEPSVNTQCKDACSKIVSLSTYTEKIRTSLANLLLHATKIISMSDLVTSVITAAKIQKEIEECLPKVENHSAEKLDVGYSNWGEHMDLVMNNLGLKLNIPSYKTVTKIDECRYSDKHTSINVSSISTTAAHCAMSCTDSNALSVVLTPGCNFEQAVRIGQRDLFLLCAANDQVFLSLTANMEVIVWNKSNMKITYLHKSDMYPHGIAYRSNNGYEELVICFLRDDADLMSTTQSNGVVKVLPLDDKKLTYDFMPEKSPAPTRVSVSKHDGLVCLSYPCIGKVSVHTKDGIIIFWFDGNSFGLNQTLFRPFGVCFDNENCLIVADRDGGQILRVSTLGQFMKTLIKGNKPTAIGVGLDDKLWVGYKDINVTVFQMTNKDL